ncbi:MAG TPA: hypothetical protein VMH89_10530 [Candidatus Acidoferrum sp.]|nr:hypothetical protein [Candidatus Acidoferrum sp.]
MKKKNSQPVFQEYAFDPAFRGKAAVDELLRVASKEDLEDDRGFLYGFQIKRFRTGYRKNSPRWARAKIDIGKLLLRAFPKLATNASQRRRAGRWAQIINMWYLMGWSESEIAEELGMSVENVRFKLVCIDRVSKGFRANGSGPLSEKRTKHLPKP